ncbi:MAG: primosomal protein N' [Spirochaetaceae bacterium]|nr:primosomal protein N' [Spirochaetaceae bacterium]
MSEYLKVAFNVPLPEAFTYRNDPEKPASLGRRVAAPFGRRDLIGYVVGELDAPDIDEKLVKRIIRRVDEEPLFDARSVELARWMAGMYYCGLGEALGSMLPSGKRETAPPAIEAEDFEIGARPLALSEEQAAALERITREKAGLSYLYGLTGTGKTEVFLQAAEATLAEGRGVIYLVPEIALTGQIVEQAEARFGARCSVIHSRVSPSRKLAEWRRILRGEADVVIGARSAVFAPLPRLGLVVIDEEHEASYKAGSSPRYHARQVALKRRALEGARVVMGSATPSAEAWRLMEEGSFSRLPLTRRLSGGAPPAVEVVDMRGEEGSISRRLQDAVRETARAGGQSILFLNRRGFSYFFRCRSCGAEMRCRHCSVALTYHKDREALVCHYCGYRAAPPRACPECGSLDVGYAGFGTERVEEEAGRLFPDLRIKRLDADSTARKGELEAALTDFRDGKADLLLGTQMVAKGLNFPRVKTVGVVLADTTLNLPDFRAAERAFSLIVQVAGRAGRFSPDGRVFVQTFRPESPVIRLAAGLDAPAFYRLELEARRELGFPPYTRLVRLVFRSKDKAKAVEAARAFSEAAARELPGEAEILGPAECPLGMVAGTARWQVIFRAAELKSIHGPVARLLASFELPSGVRVEADVDPASLM